MPALKGLKGGVEGGLLCRRMCRGVVVAALAVVDMTASTTDESLRRC